MHKYEVIVWWSEKDQAYIAEVPELPGCMSDGGTYEEAFKSIQIIISEWVETAKKLGREFLNQKESLCMHNFFNCYHSQSFFCHSPFSFCHSCGSRNLSFPSVKFQVTG